MPAPQYAATVIGRFALVHPCPVADPQNAVGLLVGRCGQAVRQGGDGFHRPAFTEVTNNGYKDLFTQGCIRCGRPLDLIGLGPIARDLN